MQWMSRSHPGLESCEADLFTLIWEALADLLGTATTAVVLRRAARRAVAACPELAELDISVRDFEYRYNLPRVWTERRDATASGLGTLVGELLPILLDLTGRIAVRRLEEIPELAASGLLPPRPEEDVL
jgi:hypothetical protein